MKRWWRLLWIVAASVLPTWPGHGVPLCPLPAAPTSAFFGTDLLANGNPIGSGGDSYQYQPLDRLVSRDNGAVLLGYNGDGAWVKKTVGGTTTFYLVDDRNPTGYAEVVEEHQSVNGGAATLTAVYTHGLDLIAQRRSGSVRYFSYDGHGSTRLLTDASGAVTDTYLYDAYGTLLASTGSTPNNYLYCGEQFDPDLGMYSLRARYYQPQTGRFWTMDTFEGDREDPLSLHKYLYCHADPVNGVDPSGHEFNLVSLQTTTLTMARLAARYVGSVASRAGPILRRYFASEKMARRAALGAAVGLAMDEYADVYIPPAVDELIKLSNELDSVPSLPNGKNPSAEVMRLAVLGAEVQEQLAAGAVSAPLRAQLPPYNWVRNGVLAYEGFSYIACIQQTVAETAAAFGINIKVDIAEWKIIWFTLIGQLDPAGDIRTFREALQAYKQHDMGTIATKALELQKRLDKYGTVTASPAGPTQSGP